ncbi:phosphoribosylformylglycinamidine cyclo-ligase [Helicobacter mehlei]|uniref:Phosphoribosylformylglycinamidine cyclo-ligase n=1 Tax=Helicobacter mehlei TaxID=2316080 RepID=A0A553UNG5_9HELI|nr:phosphoribosylformylglycinamidine cyclo-ligase [Helicobacter mehlei]TSA81758.1 phosphoribosylformylglycinamidine cyclo-ligase [Helicobacter mehlei]
MESYKQAGVNVQAGYEAVERMKKHIARTKIQPLNTIGGFAGLFALDLKDYSQPVLVSGADGVGTKLKLAFLLEDHSSIGIDCVAMCVNDVLCMGAKPLFFLDYIALDKNEPSKVESIVAGVAQGCIEADCELLGGESAEMPGFYAPKEYDLAGFCVGIVEQSQILDSKSVQVGDVLIGLASSGLHSNGFSLVRQILANQRIDALHTDFEGQNLAQVLLTPTRIYVKPVLELLAKIRVKSIAHITGGGFLENIPRALPDGLKAKIDLKAFPTPPIFDFLRSLGGLGLLECFSVFNMGVGMVIVLESGHASQALEILKQAGVSAYVIGEVVSGEGVELC